MVWMLLVLALADWAAIVPPLTKHVPRIEIRKGDQTGICSAVVFEIDEGYAHALTAAHCVDKQPTERMDVTANGRTAVVIHSNSLLDLAVIRFRVKDETPIALAADEPAAGSPIAIIGYAFGEEDIVAQFGHIAQSYNKPSRTTWIDATLIFGDSGGLLVNASGELIGINSAIRSQGPARIGMVVNVTQIRDYLDAFRSMVADQKKERR